MGWGVRAQSHTERLMQVGKLAELLLTPAMPGELQYM